MNILYPLLFCYLLLGFSQGTNITAKQAKKQLSDYGAQNETYIED